jgi:deoxyribodipyrimidine photo-lyase
VTQSERFDAEGKFIRCYVPELMSADEQQRSGCVMGRDYPGSVVEHAKAREVALALFKKDK